MRLGLLADTHLPSLMSSLDELGAAPGDALRGADLILHAGDVTSPTVLDWCEQFAPVVVARGNHDIVDDPRLAPMQFLDIEGWRIGMAHELRPESRPIADIRRSALDDAEIDILIGGDTHVERLEWREDVLFINPGSPNLPHHLTTRLGSVAVLDLAPGRARAEILALGDTPDARNPVRSRVLAIEAGAVVAAAVEGRAVDAATYAALTRNGNGRA